MPTPANLMVPRHSLVVRLTHWINVLVLLVLLTSGLQIFNAHPALYWGEISTFDDPLISMRAVRPAEGDADAGLNAVSHTI